ncbi:MAG: class I adenylate-forming enzyme family protein [Eubacteriales bacterium]|nr:class I adenylate-forming enzyme family protein [Eubacteriales bacterium]
MRAEQRYPLTEVISGGTQYLAYQMPFQNLYETLSATGKRLPNKVGLIDADGEITFSDLLEKVDAFSAYLAHAFEIGAGSRIALAMGNSIDFCIAFYGAQKLGATVVSVNTKLSAEEMQFILDDSQAECLMIDSAWFAKVEGILPQTHIKHILLAGQETAAAKCTMATAVKIGRQLPFVPVVREDSLPAVIMYTSGTTGRPKGAVMTHFNLMQAFYAYAVADDMDETESTVLSVPVFHITGLNCVLTLFVFLGGLVVLVPYFDAVDVLDKMTRYKVTHFHAVATVFIMLASAVLERHDLSALRTALCGGGFISRKTVEYFCRKATNCRFHPVYGMTETSGAGTYFPVHCLDSDIENSCGTVEPNCSIRVVDPQEREVAVGENGEICFKGPFVISHYLHGIGNENFNDGWLHSGDVGCFDANGYLFIKDRIKDMINRGGEKIFSLSVEDAAMKYGRIKQVAVFAVDDSLYGEVPAAVVIPGPGEKIDIEDLRRYLRDRLAHFKVPVYIELRDSLPTTANGKAQKYQLRKEFNLKYAK